jgi:hypothetical protein
MRRHEIHRAIDSIAGRPYDSIMGPELLGDKLSGEMKTVRSLRDRRVILNSVPRRSINKSLLLYLEATIISKRLIELGMEAANLGYGPEVDQAHSAAMDVNDQLLRDIREHATASTNDGRGDDISELYFGVLPDYSEGWYDAEWRRVDTRLKRVSRVAERRRKRDEVERRAPKNVPISAGAALA